VRHGAEERAALAEVFGVEAENVRLRDCPEPAHLGPNPETL
jgi:hypothetical protein